MSWSGGNVPASGATIPVTVISEKPWTAGTPYNWVTLSQSTGDSGTTSLNATWAANDTNYTRDAYLTIQTATRTTRSPALRQDGVNMPYMVITPSSVTDFPASGGTLTFTVLDTNANSWWGYSNQEWATFSNGNTNMHGYGNTITMNIEPNTTGASRYYWLGINDADLGATMINMTVTQLG